MATTAIIDLKDFTPNIIKDQELWGDFLDVVSDELDLLRVEIELKQRLFQTDLYTDENELIDLAKSLGYSPNLILNSDIDFIRSEVDSIVFKIKNKATYAYYNYLFKLIPREGQVYILFQDSLTLARAIDYVATYSALETHDIATPFTGMRSILHYNTYLDDSTQLDLLPDPLILDDDPTWYLDQDIVIKPTQHLAIEYQIGELVQNEVGEDVLLTADYLAYLYVGVEYGRKVTNIPHIGANVSIPIGSSGFANDLSVAENIAQGTVDEQYTIPALKIHAALSQKGLTDFAYMYLAVGTGAKGFYNTVDAGLLTDLDVNMSFENSLTDVFLDNNNDLEAIVVAGTHTIEEGISGKTIGWNGTNTEVEIAGVTLDANDREFSFWIDADAQIGTDPQLVFITGYLSIYYDTTAEEINCVLNMLTGAPVLVFPITPANLIASEFMLSVEIINLTTAKLYIDAVEEDSINISALTLSALTNESIFLGCTNLSSNFYTGRLDEFRIYSKTLTPAERTAAFERKLGSLNYLSNEFYRKQISINQVGASGIWKHAVGTIPANSTFPETVFIGDDVTVTINGTLDFPNISPGYVDFAYYSFPNFYTAKANERGQIFGEAATGSIDFETGVFQLITYRDYAVNKELIFTGTTSLISYSTEYTNIVPTTATLHYTISGTAYAIQDDGAGNFVDAPTLTVGTINYSTGAVEVTFVNPTEASPAEIYLVYDYRKESTPTLNEKVTAEYKLVGNIPITEVALLNEAGEALVYANIPTIEHDSVVNHIGFQFFIQD